MNDLQLREALVGREVTIFGLRNMETDIDLGRSPSTLHGEVASTCLPTFLPSVCVPQEMAQRGVANPIFKVLKVPRSVQRNQQVSKVASVRRSSFNTPLGLPLTHPFQLQKN